MGRRNRNTKGTCQFTFYIPQQLKDRLLEHCDRRYISATSVINELLHEYAYDEYAERKGDR